MNEELKTFLVEAFWFILPLVVGFLFNVLRTSSIANSRKRLLRITGNVDQGDTWLKFITANTAQQDNAELVTLGYVFEYRGAGELGSTMNKLYGPNLQITTVMSKPSFTSYSESDLDCNLILIGGPFHNSVTREFIRQMGDTFPFHYKEDATLVYTHPETKEEIPFTPKTVMDEQDPTREKYYGDDFALVLNVKNPFDESKRVIFISGCRSIGCYGGAIFLSQQLKDLKGQKLSDEYALVVSCSGDGEDLKSRPKLAYLDKEKKIPAIIPLNIAYQ